MKLNLRAAYESCCHQFSPDRVVADPDLNSSFLEECRRRGLTGPPETLNRALLNLRKQGGLRGLESKRSSFPNEDDYAFAAEIAARFLECRDGLSVDEIICDPRAAREFDELADRIAPGYRAVEYRWAALNMRKARRLRPELISRVVPAEQVNIFDVKDIDITRLPARQGVYVLFTTNRTLYVGEAENLQNRIRKHLDHSDNKGLARWLWDEGPEAVFVEVHTLPVTTSTRIRRAVEAELILSRDPLFNIQR
jgi:hypothetical protein